MGRKKGTGKGNGMCDLVELSIGDRQIRIADIKKAYIENIVRCVPLCNAIDKVVLFGSALETRCTEGSDLDIAIFGKYPKSKMYKLKSYHNFVEAVVSFGGLQDYDMLYYSTKQQDDSGILQNIQEGEVIYERM